MKYKGYYSSVYNFKFQSENLPETSSDFKSLINLIDMNSQKRKNSLSKTQGMQQCIILKFTFNNNNQVREKLIECLKSSKT